VFELCYSRVAISRKTASIPSPDLAEVRKSLDPMLVA